MLNGYLKPTCEVRNDEYPLICICHTFDKCIAVKKEEVIPGVDTKVLCTNCGATLGIFVPANKSEGEILLDDLITYGKRKGIDITSLVTEFKSNRFYKV